MEWVYLMFLLMGLFYALLVGVVGDLFAHGGGGGLGHIDMNHDLITQADVSGADQGMVHFSPFSPATLATFIGAFGATGLVAMKLFHLPVVIHLPVSLASGFIISAIAFYFFQKLFSVTQSTSQPQMGEMIGLDAEVLTSIPEQGLGQIAYTDRGSRYTAAARSVTGQTISAYQGVVIKKVVGDIFYVETKS